MTLKLSDSDRLLAGFNPDYVHRGHRYVRDRRVLETATEERDSSLVVTGRVRGSGQHLYSVHVHIDEGFVNGTCTCPVAWNCKHVVAVLIAAARQETTLNPPARADRYALPDADEEESYPPEIDNRLLYLLQLGSATNTLIMRPFRSRLTRSGAYGTLSPFRPSRVWEPFPPRYLLKSDIAILRNLIPAHNVSEFPEGVPIPPDAVPLVERMIASGRCHWAHVANPALRPGNQCRAEASWELMPDGRQRLILSAGDTPLVAPALNPPRYIDTVDHVSGPLTSDLPELLLAELVKRPFITANEVDDVLDDWERRFADIAFARPRRLSVHRLPPTQPTPVLHLYNAEVTDYQGTHRLPAARLSFDYDGHLLSWPGEDIEQVVSGEKIVRLDRDQEFEEDAALRLRDRGLHPLFAFEGLSAAPDDSSAWVPSNSAGELESWLALQTDLPTLQAEGWRISIGDDFNYRAVTPDAWYGDIEADSGRQWFDLELGIEIEGERISLLPMLLEWIEQIPAGALSGLLEEFPDDEGLPIRLDNRRIAYLPIARLKGILTILVELFDPEVRLKDGRLSLPALRAGELPLLERNDWNWSGGDELRRLGERLHAFSGITEVPPPTSFKAALRQYQQTGLDWLQFLREFGLGGILADDMGLGKTVQTLAHLMVEKESGRLDRPALVVAPTSLMFNWRAEAARFAPSLKVLTLHGPDRADRFRHITDADLVLTTYPLVGRDIDTLGEHQFHLLILDEAQAIKNPRAKVSHHVRELSARHRLCLTGTPMENHLGELWSVFDFLLPGLLGNERQFRRLFRNAIERQGDDSRRAALERRIRPFFLRRTKAEVAPELPPKSEILRSVALEGAQRDLYETVRLAMHGKVRAALSEQGLDRSRIVVLDALLKLRQVCCDPRLLKGTKRTGRTGSAKLRMLMELLPEMLEEGRRVLLFSQFTSMLALIEEELNKRRIPYVKLTGKTRDRETPVERFQSGEIPLFLISLKAGGTGLNLTAADTVIHYDPWWNPAVEDQATDRAHRIGQQNKVFVYRLITEGSVEEKIVRMQEEKRGLVESLFSATGPKAIDAGDLEALFEPLG
ncbi:DEAD/DEAH box helicase [Thiohalomonas denitrificans]|uniref:SWIM zinc finger n=1 Tax=Thiohalomonas denitrificans TaxID=415747 RepID=A0A1G5QE89_9GAMM|nr:DEAD/DEAH box helicase [Thiohalomonas denitrificans]SCZ59972.1 SWIM zinc finger [Thiohalomonas denitrificans]